MVHPLSFPTSPQSSNSFMDSSLGKYVSASAQSLNPYNVVWDIVNYRDKKESQDYARALQKHLEEREDTAYQRTAEDMRKAGLNPLSMQGTDNAGSEVSQPDTTSGTPAESISTTVQRFIDNANNTMLAMESQKDSENQRRLNTMKTIQEVAQMKANIKNMSLDSESKRMLNKHMQREYEHMINNNLYDSDNGLQQQLKAITTFLTSDVPEIKEQLIQKYPVFKYIDDFIKNGTLPESAINYLKNNHPIWYFMISPFLPKEEKSVLNTEQVSNNLDSALQSYDNGWKSARDR